MFENFELFFYVALDIDAVTPQFSFLNEIISGRRIDRPLTFHQPHFSNHFRRFELASVNGAKWI